MWQAAAIIALAFIFFLMLCRGREEFLVPKLAIANMAYRSLPGDAPAPRSYVLPYDQVPNPQIF